VADEHNVIEFLEFDDVAYVGDVRLQTDGGAR